MDLITFSNVVIHIRHIIIAQSYEKDWKLFFMSKGTQWLNDERFYLVLLSQAWGQMNLFIAWGLL